MTAILGISAFYHDSAAALVVDGRIVAAAQEERFTRTKHDDRFPLLAVEYCLQEGALNPGDLDYVGFYDKPLLKFERLLETYLAFAPRGFRSFAKAMPLWLGWKLHVGREIRKRTPTPIPAAMRVHRAPPVACRQRVLPFAVRRGRDPDARRRGRVGHGQPGLGRGNRIAMTDEMRFPHSLGLLYSAFTYFCGFRVNSGEYKLMGLAPYGEPVYAETIRRELIDLKDDGSFRMDMSYFRYCQGLVMTSRRLERLFDGPPRKPEGPLTQREMDLAASIQQVTEEIMLRSVRHLHRKTGMKNLCLAGGVALNCVANGRILREGPFENIWIQPAAGDAGGALGTALFVWHQLLDKPRTAVDNDAQQGSMLGPRFSEGEIRTFLGRQRGKIPLLGRRGRIVRPRGRFGGRGEGRGLGARPDGIRTESLGWSEHIGRRPQSADAGFDEPQDQVPRVIPPLCSGGAAGAG